MISIDYTTYVINVPKADTQFVETNPQTGLEVRALNIVTFGKALADVQDNSQDVWAPTAFTYTAPADVGGVFLAPVLLILSPYTVTFEDGQYAVNFVGGNTNLQDFVNVNQVSIRPANSAGQTFSKAAEDSAFGDNRVWIDTVNGLPGIEYPRGTPGDPVDNWDDAVLILATRNLPKRIHLTGLITTDAADDLSDFDILGASANLAEIDVATGTNTTNLVVRSLSMTGDLNGNVTAYNATSFNNIIDFDGQMVMCGLKGTIGLGSAGASHTFVDCFSEVEGNSKPILDCDNLVNNKIQFRRYSGGLEVRNFVNGGSAMSLYVNQGNLLLDSSCTGGEIVINGTGVLIDNSGAGCNVIVDGFNAGGSGASPSAIADAVWDEDLSTYANGTAGDKVNKKLLDKGTFISLK
jgi:hypothetical protein